jgi:23S rRNA pseudouridine2457 synthase
MEPGHKHFLLYKPFGYISQFKTDAKKKKLLGELYDFPEGTMAIGRLDEESEGLLLLTTHGMTSEIIRGKHIEKEYYVQLDGIITVESLKLLREGVVIGMRNAKYKTLPCEVKVLDPAPVFPERARRVRDDRHGPTSWVSITLVEGKNRQIRKMTAAVGFPTLRLVRVRIGEFTLNGMLPDDVLEIKL